MKNKIDSRYKLFIVGTLVWGILAHGMMLFNKIPGMDEIHNMFNVGATFTSGRWMLGTLDLIMRFLLGSKQYSIPLFNGGCAFIIIAVAGCFIINLFEIKKRASIVVVSGLMVMFPVVVGIFGYMFTAPYYLLGLLFSVIGAWMICKHYFKFWRIALGCLLIGCALGIYQAWLPFALSVMLMYFLKLTIDDGQAEWIMFIKRAIYFGSSCILSMAFYLGFMWLSLKISGLQLTEYKGINSFGYQGIRGYMERAFLAYKEFFFPTTDPDFVRWNMYPQGMAMGYKVIIALILIFGFYIVITSFTQNKRQGIQSMLLLMLIPLAVNFIFVMVWKWYIYVLMMYSQVMVFVFAIWLAESTDFRIKARRTEIGYKVVLAAMIYACVIYCRYANICYLKAEMMQSQAVSYYATLITRIESIEGYIDELPVAFINSDNKTDNNWPQIQELEEITIEPYTWDCVINDNSWIGYMKYRCGYEPKIVEDTEALEQNEKVIAMPSYPDDGSIELVDGVIVVKF